MRTIVDGAEKEVVNDPHSTTARTVSTSNTPHCSPPPPHTHTPRDSAREGRGGEREAERSVGQPDTKRQFIVSRAGRKTDEHRASNCDVCACCIADLRKGSLQIQVAFLARAEFCFQSSNSSPHAAVDAVHTRYVARCVDMDHCLTDQTGRRGCQAATRENHKNTTLLHMKSDRPKRSGRCFAT